MRRSTISFALSLVLATTLARAADDGAQAPAAEPKPTKVTAPVKPPVKPPTGAGAKKPGVDPANAVLATAIEKLTAEYKAAQKGGTLRTKADYFESPPAGVTPEKVLNAIAKPLASNPSQDAYVRWQLCSAIAGPLDAKLAQRALAIHRSSPKPITRFGCSIEDRKALGKLQTDRSLTDERAKVIFDNAMARWSAANVPIYAFRAELIARVPTSAESLVTMLADAGDRHRAADTVAVADVLNAASTSSTNWAIGLQDPRQTIPVMDAIGQLRKEAPVEYAAEFVLPVGTGGQRLARFQTARPTWRQLNEIIESFRSVSQMNNDDKTDKKGK